MISKSKAFPCARSRGMSVEYWWRANELGDLDPDIDRRRSECRGTIIAQGGDPAAGTFFRLQSRDAALQRHEFGRKSAVLGRHAVLRDECLRLAGRALQGTREHGVPHAVLGLYRRGRGVGVMVGRDPCSVESAGNCLDVSV